MKISAALIVKNEEACLGECLESIKGVDEIVICDTGSTDRTVEIAEKYGKVYTDYKWNDNFAEARNHVKNKCTGDWILSIDADEKLISSVDEIRSVIDTDADGIDVIMFSTDEFKFPRLFRNKPYIRWMGRAHNYLNGIRKKISSDIKIHYGYSPTHKENPDRTLNILKKAVSDGSREKFYLAREYYYRKDYNNCVKWLDEYNKKPAWAAEWAEVNLLRARCLWQLQRGEEARDACLQAIKINTHFKEAIEFMAEMSGPINRKRWEEFAKGADNSNVLFIRTKKEKGADYYNKLFKEQTDFSRYNEIHKKIGELVGDDKVLDIGCGRGDVSKYIKNYSGFDFSKEAIKHVPNSWVGDIYNKDNYKEVDTYLLLEVLEHVDEKVLELIPGKLIFSVPNFKDPSHLRIYNEDSIKKLGAKIIAIYGWDGKWKEGINSNNKIYLCQLNK